jgi:hypothetical protein
MADYSFNSSDTPATMKAKIEGSIVTKTLDTLNSGTLTSCSGKKKSFSKTNDRMKQTYDFSKSVLSAVYEGKGTIVDSSK